MKGCEREANYKSFCSCCFCLFDVCVLCSSVTTFASDGHDAGLCAQCGESNDGHVGAVTVEHDGEHQTFCCPSCATKYANAHQEGTHNMKTQAITNTKAMMSTKLMTNMRAMIIKTN